MLGWYFGAALLVGAAFVLGAWIGHVAAERVASARWYGMRVRIRAGRSLLVDATVLQLVTAQQMLALPPREGYRGVPLALELDLHPRDVP